MSLTVIAPVNQRSKPNFGDNQGIWEYRDIDNKFVCYVVRKQKEGKKFFIPWTFQEGKWIKRWTKDLPKPFYNIHSLRKNPSKSVLLVEGEKTADAAIKLFPDFNVLTWMGGAQAIKNVELEYLSGLDVYLLPDNDKPGYKAMEALKERLLTICKSVYFIDIASLNLSPGWDLADLNDGEIDFYDIEILVNETNQILKEPCKLDKYSFPFLNSKFKVINTYENLEHLCNHFGIAIRFNSMRNDIEIFTPQKNFSMANKSKLEVAEITSLCIKNGMPRTDILQWLVMIADKNAYNPLELFILSKSWDGISRIKDFFNTIQCNDNKVRDIYLYRWMIGAIAVGLSKIGLAHPGVLTFISKQGAGKSSWVRKLLPENLNLILGEFILNPDDKDSVIRATKYWIVELAEADATVGKSEASAQKAFLSRKTDLYRCPYDKTDTEAPRHTCFIGTVNDSQFLKDETGNRRWWVLDVLSIDYKHTIDMQQLWAEFKVIFDRGEQFHLTDEELNLLMEKNEAYRPISAIEEAIINRYHWDDNLRNRRLTALQVLEDCGFDIKRNKILQSKEANRVLKKLTNEESKKIGGLFYFFLPRQKSIFLHN